ncbi:MAG: glycosyltransferase family 2 protein [Bacteroidota bacterium]
MEHLSVVLTTLNEEHNIDRCLGSVRWADEIIVVDSFSWDHTVERARQYTSRVYQHEYPGSSRQVERGISYATGEWVFIIDADEEMTEDLAREIQAMLREGTDAAAFEILRKPSAFGKWIEHGGWYPDYQMRLLRKNDYRPEHQEVHGGFTTAGRRGRMNGLLLHHTYPTIYSYVEKMNDYTSLQVSNKLKADPGVEAPWHKLLLSPLSHFLRMFFSKKGYKDGFHGFVLSLLDATYTMLLYAKLWEYRQRAREGNAAIPPITNSQLNVLKHKQ